MPVIQPDPGVRRAYRSDVPPLKQKQISAQCEHTEGEKFTCEVPVELPLNFCEDPNL